MDSDAAHANIISSLQRTASILLTLLELGPRLLSDEEFAEETSNLMTSAYLLVQLSDQLLNSRSILSGFRSLPSLDNVSVVESIQRTMIRLPYIVEHAGSTSNEDFTEELNDMFAALHFFILLCIQLSSSRFIEKSTLQADFSASRHYGESQADSLPSVVREFQEMFNTEGLGDNTERFMAPLPPAPKFRVISDASDAPSQTLQTTGSQSPTDSSPAPDSEPMHLHHNTAEKTIQTEGITVPHGFISLHIDEIPVEVVRLL